MIKAFAQFTENIDLQRSSKDFNNKFDLALIYSQ